MGLVYTQLDRLDEAQAAYDEAIVHCDAAGDVPHRLLALINAARPVARARRRRASGGAVRDGVRRGHRAPATNARLARRTSTSASSRGRGATRRRRAPTRARRTTTRCAAKISCSPARRRANRPSCTSRWARIARRSRRSRSRTVCSPSSRAAQPRRAQSASGASRGGSTYVVARWARIDRIEGRLHARPLRARRGLRVRAGSRHRLRRDHDVLVPHRRAAARRRQDRRADRDLEQARPADPGGALGDGTARRGRGATCWRHRFSVGHPADRARTPRAMGRRRISGPSGGRRRSRSRRASSASPTCSTR